MAKKKQKELSQEFLKGLIRSKAKYLLDKPNVTSIGVGYKIKDGKRTDQLSVQVTVERKLSPEALRTESLDPLDKSITADDGTHVPIDVIQRDYKLTFQMVSDPEAEALSEEITPHQKRRSRLGKVIPGISISHPSGTAGTFGAVVFDNDSGQPFMLSNWHVLQQSGGQIGDAVVQPGPFDDSNTDNNVMGRLVRSHLGLAGDCAIASIDSRSFDEKILEIDVIPKRVAKVNLGDRVIKSGRTSGVTYGVVQRVEVVVNLNYGGSAGVQQIGGFEIGPDPEHPSANGEVSEGGDSGSLWLIHENGQATDIAVGLHFAGETDPDPDAEHALACNIHSVLEKLNVSFVEKDEALMEEEDLLNQVLSRLALQSSQLKALETRLTQCQCHPTSDARTTSPAGQTIAGGVKGARSATAEGLSLPVYGNWCGPGHGGGTPIDDLDRACMQHDRCYDRKGYFNCTCDAQLIQDIGHALDSGNVNPAGRLAGPAISTWFHAQPCFYHVGGIPIPGGTGGTVNAISAVGGAVKSVTRGGKKVWKKIKKWF